MTRRSPRRSIAAKYTRRRRKRAYTVGELNTLVDAVLHPLAKLDPAFLIVDGAVHCVIERNPSKSVVKFIHYNLPKLVAQRMRNRENGQ